MQCFEFKRSTQTHDRQHMRICCMYRLLLCLLCDINNFLFLFPLFSFFLNIFFRETATDNSTNTHPAVNNLNIMQFFVLNNFITISIFNRLRPNPTGWWIPIANSSQKSVAASPHSSEWLAAVHDRRLYFNTFCYERCWGDGGDGTCVKPKMKWKCERDTTAVNTQSNEQRNYILISGNNI